MATEKTKKQKSGDGKEKRRARSSPDASPAKDRPKASDEPEMRSALLPLIWLLIPFIAVVAYGLLTRE